MKRMRKGLKGTKMRTENRTKKHLEEKRSGKK